MEFKDSETCRQLVVVAGPNGCGKTTFVEGYLEQNPIPYISADIIANEMNATNIDDIRLQAGRQFFQEIEAKIHNGDSCVIESTLSGKTLRNIINDSKKAGFRVVIIFIFLASPELCLARIAERERKGGHTVAEEDVRRRFSRSIRNFWIEYKNLADVWHLFYNGGTQFHEVALGEGTMVEVRDDDVYSTFLEIVNVEES